MISINGQEIHPTLFPDGTSQVWKLDEALLEDLYKKNLCEIDWVLQDESELVWLAQLKTLLDPICDNVHLNIPFLPYGRQDKAVSNNNTFALRTFAMLINAMKFQLVTTIDAHNNTRAHMIENLEDLSAEEYIEKAYEGSGSDLVLYPDSGAQIRYSGLHCNRKYVCAEKVRNQDTGKIESFKIGGNVKGKNLLIVDDICDGGATFVLASWSAYKAGAKAVNLYVTHGIFSKGVQVLRDAGIRKIYTYKGEVE